MTNYNLLGLILKPTLRCNANCLGCSSRRSLHKSAGKDEALSLDHWKAILHEGKSLGLEEIKISGGEPTLSPILIDLIKEGKRLGLSVRLNTNGGLITKDFAEQLLAAGLDTVCISIYSHRPEVHDVFRQSKGLWNNATQAVRIFAKLRQDRHQDFFLQTMSIILRENFRSLDDLIRLHHQLGSQQMGIAYLEGDFSRRYLLTKLEILEFQQKVVPRILAFCNTLEPRIKGIAIDQARRLYSPSSGKINDFEKGIYWRKGKCRKPSTKGLILANGDIHPCNIVEYTHKPVMGNLLKNGLTEIWNSKTWNIYRKKLHEKCPNCPINIYQKIPLADSSEFKQ